MPQWFEAMKAKGHTPRMCVPSDGSEPIIDMFAMDGGHHNGPGCSVCGWSCCEHCSSIEDIPECVPPKPKIRYTAEFNMPNTTKRTKIDRVISIEDGGSAVMVEASPSEETGGDGQFFVRLHSWKQNGDFKNNPGDHSFFKSLMGKRVRVTVEVIEE